MKKKIMGMALALVLLLSCIAPAGALAETLTGTVKMPNAGGSLHLRAAESKTSASRGYVQDGDTLKVYIDDADRDNEDELWVKVKVDRTGRTGYIKGKYISRFYGPMVYVSSDGGSLKLRKGPGTSFGVAGYVQHKQYISVLNRGTTWSKVKVADSGVTGYIKTKYIFGATEGVTVSGPAVSGGTTAPAVTKPAKYDAASVMTRTAFGVVNVRKGAGTGYASAAKLGRGEKLYVTGKTGEWYKVQTVDGKTGYIREDYVSFGVSAKTTGAVNFRKGAGTNWGIIRELSKGSAVMLHSVDGKWAKVSYAGKSGYVHTSYLNLY